MSSPDKSLLPYDIEPADAVFLLALLDGGPVPIRSADDLLGLLRNTLKLVESIADNCRDWLETCAIIHGDMHPYSAEKLNVPTVRGALAAAVVIPRVRDCGMCHTCAFRVGSPANQCESTAEDIMGCLLDGEPFLCHDVEDGEQPRKLCRGFAEARRTRAEMAATLATEGGEDF